MSERELVSERGGADSDREIRLEREKERRTIERERKGDDERLRRRT